MADWSVISLVKQAKRLSNLHISMTMRSNLETGNRPIYWQMLLRQNLPASALWLSMHQNLFRQLAEKVQRANYPIISWWSSSSILMKTKISSWRCALALFQALRCALRRLRRSAHQILSVASTKIVSAIASIAIISRDPSVAFWSNWEPMSNIRSRAGKTARILRRKSSPFD